MALRSKSTLTRQDVRYLTVMRRRSMAISRLRAGPKVAPRRERTKEDVVCPIGGRRGGRVLSGLCQG